MLAKKYFVSYLDKQFQIPDSEASIAFIIIFLIFIVLILFTSKFNNNDKVGKNDHFRLETSYTLKGVAILCLIIGHFTINCVQGAFFFRFAGRWAVIIFLYISGVGLAKKYYLSNVPANFLYKRIAKLMPSVWVAMSLFISLDYVLVGKTYSPIVILLNFLGIITPRSADAPAWYVTFIIFLYCAYYLVSKIDTNDTKKIFILFSTCYAVSVALWSINPLYYYIGIWAQYTVVFPAAVGIGLYLQQLHDSLATLFRKHNVLYVVVMLLILYLFINQKGHFMFSHIMNSYVFSETVSMTYDLLFICFLLLVTIIIDCCKFESLFLSVLGKYSYEIFLIHFPFMQKYDFLLFHKPVVLAFLLYLSILILASIAFKIVTNYLSNIIKIRY